MMQGKVADRDAVDAFLKRTPNLRPRPGVSNLLIEGRSVIFTTDGIDIAEVYSVEGIDQNHFGEQTLYANGIPVPWLGHTHREFGSVPCVQTEAQSIKGLPGSAKVTARYSLGSRGFNLYLPPDHTRRPQLEVRSQLQSLRSNHHFEGVGNDTLEPIILDEEVIIEDPVSQTSTTRRVKRSPIVQAPLPITTLVYRRLESRIRAFSSSLPGYTIGDIAIEFTGTVNDRIIFVNKPRASFLCTSVIGVSADNGETFDVTYTFTYHPFTWKILCQLLDESGHPYPNLTWGQGKKLVRVNKEMNFKLLQLNVGM